MTTKERNLIKTQDDNIIWINVMRKVVGETKTQREGLKEREREKPQTTLTTTIMALLNSIRQFWSRKMLNE